VENLLEKRMASFRPVSQAAASEYGIKAPEIVKSVKAAMLAREDFYELIGEIPVDAVLENNQHHTATIAEVMESGRYDLMARLVPWVYRSYMARGVTSAYFPALFSEFKKVLENVLSPDAFLEVRRLYDVLLETYEAMVAYSCQEESAKGPLGGVHGTVLEFRDALLSGDHRTCLDMATESVTSSDELEAFYLKVIQPAMYSIGSLWEQGKISVAEEHLASAIVARVMASLYVWALRSPRRLGKAVVSAAPNEFHEIGARMVADLLERDGWNVEYLGSDMEHHSLVDRVEKTKPFLIALSVSMPFNLKTAREIISGVREKALENLRIMLGGQVFERAPDLWKTMGADGYAADAAEASRLAGKWWEESRRTGNS